MSNKRIVKIADNAGFCFGVKRATDALQSAIEQRESGERLFTLGHLIHNDVYNRSLEEKGVYSIEENEIEALAADACEKSPVKIFIRAHGIPKETEERLQALAENNASFSYVDCTCPYVKKIHRIAKENSGEDRIFGLMGTPTHPEVVGIMSYAEGEKFVFSDSEDVQSILKKSELGKIDKKTLVFASQTTQNLAEWEKSQKIIKKDYTNSIFFDTICNVTEIRQNEAKKLALESDFVIVIGGRESSNTAKLYNICKELCENTVHIEDVSFLEGNYPNYNKIGIVAGASTPQSSIREVFLKMSEMTENFEELLEQSLKTLNTGDTVTGYVINVTDNEIQLDLGAKVTGIIKSERITDDPSAKLTEMFKIGDAVEAFVIRVSDIEGVAELDKKRTDSEKNRKNIIAAKESGEVLSGKVVKAVKGGVEVVVDSVKIFVPASQTGVAKDGDLSVLVGTTADLKIIEVDGRRAIGSIRAVLAEARRAKEAEFWAEIENGKQYTGKVRSLTSYGAFVDLGGVDGMVHVSELSWRPVRNPAEVVSVGDEITVFVKSFDAEKRRISLGYKTDDTNPWLLFSNTYAVGDVASVKIVNMMPFGAFAEIMDGVDGLIHISKIAQQRIAKPADVLEIGQVVEAKIIEIDNEKHKVSLSIRDLLDEAQAEAEAMPEEAVEAEAEAEAVEAVEAEAVEE